MHPASLVPLVARAAPSLKRPTCSMLVIIKSRILRCTSPLCFKRPSLRVFALLLVMPHYFSGTGFHSIYHTTRCASTSCFQTPVCFSSALARGYPGPQSAHVSARVPFNVHVAVSLATIRFTATPLDCVQLCYQRPEEALDKDVCGTPGQSRGLPPCEPNNEASTPSYMLLRPYRSCLRPPRRMPTALE